MKPKIFIGSSAESIDVAHVLQSNLDSAGVAEVTVWDQDIFLPSRYALESLLATLRVTGFGIFVFSPDDQTKLRGEEYQTARDNVIFELGLFIAGLGKEQTAIVMPKNMEQFHMPSDLMGLSVATYDANRDDGNLAAALNPACEKIKKMLLKPLNRACGYLVRYVGREEPSLIGVGCNATVSFERAYKLLLYMFQNEKFDEFRAFDLAFERWGELLRPDHVQTFNIANEIIESMSSLFSQNRCKNFRRILVISYDQLRSGAALQVFQKFQEQEAEWRLLYKDLIIETRVFIYPDKSNPETRQKIRRLHDFALFSSKEESLAIVETTLTAPTDRVENPECQVVTVNDKLDMLKAGFEDFWEPSRIMSAMIDVLSQEQSGAIGKPAAEAFKRFSDVCPGNTERCAIVIEAGYFDLRTPTDEDRFHHLDDAFWLFEAVQTSCKNLDGNIFLDTFINDFNSDNVCNIKACGEDINFEAEDNRKTIIHDLLSTIKTRYKSYNLSTEDFEIFGMRKTRNKVTKVIKKALLNSKAGIHEKNFCDTIVDIYIDTDAEHILIGHRDTDANLITSLCTALMAQHYFDLYAFALKKKPKLKELWIFDFNRFTERDSVRKGAEVSFKLHSWPNDVSLHIVNCIYNPDGKTGTIELVNGPR